MVTEVEPTGVIFVGECEIQTHACTAKTPAPITAVMILQPRQQVDVCGRCVEEMVRSGTWFIRHARIPARCGVAVLDDGGQPLLVAEVKARRGVSDPAAWATQIRGNLLRHAGVPSAPYFMVVLAPDVAALWVRRGRDAADAPPDYLIDAGPALRPRLAAVEDEDEPRWRVAERSAAAWIEDLVRDGSAEPWFVESGLRDAIHGGRVVTEAAA
jgi:hypothetical protein